MQSNIFGFYRIPYCIGLLESVFRAIVNRSKACPPFFLPVVFVAEWRAGLLTISWPRHSQGWKFTPIAYYNCLTWFIKPTCPLPISNPPCSILIYLCLVHFRGIDVGEASEPFRVSSASLPNSITRVGIELFADLQIPWLRFIHIEFVKLPRFFFPSGSRRWYNIESVCNKAAEQEGKEEPHEKEKHLC